MGAIEITRTDLTGGELRAASAKTRDAKAARRMLAIALVLEGKDRKTAAETCGMDRQTLRDWVHRYNAGGLAGLKNRKAPGRPCRLNAAQKAELAALIEKGPDAEKDGVVRWRCAGLKRRIEEMFGVKLHERTVGKQLRALGYALLTNAGLVLEPDFQRLATGVLGQNGRDRPGEVFLKVSWACGSLLGCCGLTESRTTLTRIWAKRGSRPRAPRDLRHEWAYIFGAVCPARCATAALVLPYANTEAFSLHLAEIGKEVATGAHAILVLDGAGYHAAADLKAPDNVTLLPLPSYAPERIILSLLQRRL